MINIILLILSFLSFIALGIAVIYIIKLKRFEDERIINQQNILIFSLFFLLMYLAINTLNYLNKSFYSALIKISVNIPAYITILNKINSIALIPLFAVCLLAGMLTLKEL